MNETKALAVGKWRSILSAYIPVELLTGKHTACPLCNDGVDRFRWDDKDGSGSYICSHCGAGTGIHLLAQHQGIGHSEAWRLVESAVGSVVADQPRKEVDQLARVASILSTCRPGGKLVSEYLASRCIPDAPCSLQAGSWWLDGGQSRAMVAKASRGLRLTGLHLTFIRDGAKVARKMYAVANGSLVGSAIRLHPLNGGDTIVIGEGIETSLSAGIITGLPAWAAMDAGKMEQVEIPGQIRRVVIAADYDENFVGQCAAYALAKRLKAQGKSVEVIMPRKAGTDFNDRPSMQYVAGDGLRPIDYFKGTA